MLFIKTRLNTCRARSAKSTAHATTIARHRSASTLLCPANAQHRKARMRYWHAHVSALLAGLCRLVVRTCHPWQPISLTSVHSRIPATRRSSSTSGTSVPTPTTSRTANIPLGVPFAGIIACVWAPEQLG